MQTELRSRRKELTNCHQTIFQLQRDLAAAEAMSSMLSNGVQDAPTPSKFQADGCNDKSGMCCPNPNVNAETQTSQRSLQLVDKETSFSQERYEEEFEQQSSPPIEQTSTATPPLSAASSPLSSSPHPHGGVLSHVTDDKENVGLRHETRDFQHRHSPNTHQCTLSQAYIRQLKRELPHELSGHDKQGVRGRFPHSISRVLSMRQEVKQEVDEELEKEFAQQGLRFSHSRGGNKTGLTSPEYKACMDALYCRRAAALQGMRIQEQERAEFMLNSVKAHVEDVARKQVGEALLQFYCPLAQNRSTAHRKL